MHLAESAGEVEIKGNVKCYNKGGGRALVKVSVPWGRGGGGGGGESSSIGDIGINPITKYVDRLKPRQ